MSNTALFYGGPMDGKIAEMEEGRLFVEIPNFGEPPPVTFNTDRWTFPRELRNDVYRRVDMTRFHPLGRDKHGIEQQLRETRALWVHTETSSPELIDSIWRTAPVVDVQTVDLPPRRPTLEDRRVIRHLVVRAWHAGWGRGIPRSTAKFDMRHREQSLRRLRLLGLLDEGYVCRVTSKALREHGQGLKFPPSPVWAYGFLSTRKPD